MSWLPEGLERQLELEGPELRTLIAQLQAPRAAARLRALDAIAGLLMDGTELREDAPRAIPYLMGLGTARRYPEAARVLQRITRICAVIDDPPRSLAGKVGTLLERRTFDAMGAAAQALVDVARSSSDPQAARLAATLAARHPDQDAVVEPTLIALISGAGDAEERARLLYCLARIQIARGAAPFHRRIACALGAAAHTPERLAASLALLEASPPEPQASRLRAAIEAAPHGALDPRTVGRRFVPEAPD